MPTASTVEVYKVFETKNIRERSLNAVRPKLKDLDQELHISGGRRAKARRKTKTKSISVSTGVPP
jgi:hypothetical protein